MARSPRGSLARVLGLLAVCSFVLTFALGFASEARVESSVKISGGEFKVFHERPAVLPDIPDLSDPSRQNIPDRATFTVPAPILWGDTIVMPGEYGLELLVTEDYELYLNLTDRIDGQAVQVVLERADFSEPSDGLTVFLSRWTDEGRERGALNVRWGSLLLHGGFAPLRSKVSTAAGQRLSTYEFPAELSPGQELPLGRLEHGESKKSRSVLTLVYKSQGQVALRIEEELYKKRVTRRNALRREVAAVRRRVKSDQTPKEDRASLASQLKSLEARLKIIEKQLMKSDGAIVELPGRTLPSVAPTRRVSADLHETKDGCRLVVASPPGLYGFEL